MTGPRVGAEPYFLWTPERIETTERLWREGKSATEIAATISNPSRNSVIGKIHRLKLQAAGRGEPSVPRTAKPKLSGAQRRKLAAPNTGGARKVAAIRAQARAFGETRVRPAMMVIGGGTAAIEKSPGMPPTYRAKADAFAPLEGTQPIPWTLRAFGQCAWPIDVPDESEQHSCAAACGADTYCARHADMRHDRTKPAPKAHELVRSLRRYA